jgi:hypothetical protein
MSTRLEGLRSFTRRLLGSNGVKRIALIPSPKFRISVTYLLLVTLATTRRSLIL